MTTLLIHILSAEILDAFDLLDSDRDGRLTHGEIKTLFHSQFMTFTDAEVTRALRELDQDSESHIVTFEL